MSLRGKTVVVTRPAAQAEALVRLLEDRGARAIRLPTLEVRATTGTLGDEADAAAAALAAGAYEVLLLTSQNAVEQLLVRLRQRPVPPSTRVFTIGDKTAEAWRAATHGEVTVASESVGEGLVAAVQGALGAKLAGTACLLPRAKEGREVVVDTLRAAGARVEVAALYETLPVDGPALTEPVDWITFTSPSAVEGLLRRGPLPKGAHLAVIGPTTAAALAAHGLSPTVVSPGQSIEAMVEAMEEWGEG